MKLTTAVRIARAAHNAYGPAPFDAAFPRWRLVHRTASFGLGLLALVHAVYSIQIFDAWSPDAVWFLGTGLGLALLAGINIAQIGLEPCRMPTTPAVRLANWVFVAFGAASVVAAPEPQAVLIALLLVLQAVASHRTLPGPA